VHNPTTEDEPMTGLLDFEATAPLKALGARLDGELVLPGDEGWDAARTAWNLAVDQRPLAVVLAESAADVAETIRAARAAGLRVAPQGSGHGAGSLGDLSGTILLRTTRMRGVTIDPVNRGADVEAGVLWQEVSDAAAEHGLAALAGSSHDVGVLGYTLGGGISWLARKYGLSANNVLAAEIVDADGVERRIDWHNDPDLFWAIRGGGGSFVVVTALELRLFPITEVYAGTFFFPIERAPEVLRAWHELTETAPDELMSCGRLMRFPDFPEIPEPLRGNEFALVEVAYLGDEADGVELARPVRELGPVLDTTGVIPGNHLSRLHMDPPAPAPGLGDGFLLDELSADAFDAVVASAGAGSGSSRLSIELRHLGGAMARRREGDGAALLDKSFAMFAVCIAPTPEAAKRTKHDIARVLTALAPWDSGRDYSNWRETRQPGERLFSAETYARLRDVKRRVDPDDLIRSHHPVWESGRSRSRAGLGVGPV
jgi:FAD/FMN-containing dehydrogenase